MTQRFTKDDGRRLAIDMLCDIASANADEFTLDRGTRVAAGISGEQRNPVADYLREIRRRGSPELEAGFSEILSDFIASALDGGAPDPEYYEEEL